MQLSYISQFQPFGYWTYYSSSAHALSQSSLFIKVRSEMMFYGSTKTYFGTHPHSSFHVAAVPNIFAVSVGLRTNYRVVVPITSLCSRLRLRLRLRRRYRNRPRGECCPRKSTNNFDVHAFRASYLHRRKYIIRVRLRGTWIDMQKSETYKSRLVRSGKGVFRGFLEVSRLFFFIGSVCKKR